MNQKNSTLLMTGLTVVLVAALAVAAILIILIITPFNLI